MRAIVRTDALVPVSDGCLRLARILGARTLRPTRYRITKLKNVEGSKPYKRIQEFSPSNEALQSSNPRLRTGAHLDALGAECVYRWFESPRAHVSAHGSQQALQEFESLQVHCMGSIPPNFWDDTPQTHNHSRDHHGRWAKPSSGPPSRSLSSSQSGCSIVMGIC